MSDDLADVGILYPTSGRRAHVHHDLSIQLYGDPRFKSNFWGYESLKTEIKEASADKVFISSEHFCIATTDQVRKLKNILAPLGEIFIIAFVRRQDLWLQSLWSQTVKIGFTVSSLEEFIADALHTPGSIDSDPVEHFHPKVSYPDFKERLAPWEEVFGNDRINLRVLEKQQIDDVFREILNIMDVEFPVDEPVENTY